MVQKFNTSDEAIVWLEGLLSRLENEGSRKNACVELSELMEVASSRSADQMQADFHFSFMQIDLSAKEEHLKLIQLPSTFAPEDWSFTFYEGLSRYSLSDFNQKTAVELGCGNGWISLALARKFNPTTMHGLDINPRAILSAKLNSYLNSIDEKGNIVFEEDGRTLFEKVTFNESDLLGHFLTTEHTQFDVIVGCIPQVLLTDMDTVENRATDDEFLYSLSNYTGKQGYVEDNFGLGLIARCAEESLRLIKPKGKLILNLGGRPGENVLRKLFTRRGFNIEKIWERKVSQAGDTEIDPLIRIEQETGHKFEFFTGVDSDHPINARTAKELVAGGGEIYHNLTVYECVAEFHHDTKRLFNSFRKPLFTSAKVGLDLHFKDTEQQEEKLRFLAEIVDQIDEAQYFQYDNTEGAKTFRSNIAKFINAYHYTSFTENHVLVAPNHYTLVDNLIQIYKPKTLCLSCELFTEFEKDTRSERVIEVPSCSTELNLLVQAIKPEILVAHIDGKRPFTYEYFEALLSVVEEAKSLLFLDISQVFELSSDPSTNEVFKYISDHKLPDNVAIICELSKNKVYKDIKTSFVISQSERILQYLTGAAEYNYSRTPIMSQQYYSILIGDLLQFQMSSVRGLSGNYGFSKAEEAGYVSPNEAVKASFIHPAVSGNSLPITDQSVRLDYGENELFSAAMVKTKLVESFTRQTFSDAEINPFNAIKKVISSRFGFDKFDRLEYGNGVAPIFAALLQLCRKEDGVMLVPEGAYGYFVGACSFYEVNMLSVPTHAENKFKVQAADLPVVENGWLFLNYPLINPTGALFSESEIDALLERCVELNVTVIVDTVFSGLEFDDVMDRSTLKKYQEKLRIYLLGGISKEFAAGGIRFGYVASNSTALGGLIKNKPHYPIMYAVNHLYHALTSDEETQLELAKQRSTLKERAEKLTEVLTTLGWKVIAPDGGLFLVAKPENLISQQNSVKDIVSRLFNDQEVLINNDEWTGISGYCRFVLSVEEHVFESALERIKKFHEAI